MESVFIKVYDDRGHTVLKKKILKHLGVKEGDLIEVRLEEKGYAILVPVKGEKDLAELSNPEGEDRVLRDRVKIIFDVSPP